MVEDENVTLRDGLFSRAMLVRGSVMAILGSADIIDSIESTWVE